MPQQEPTIPIQDLINDALQHRAELVESRIDLNSRDINNKSVRNALLPTLQALLTTVALASEATSIPAVPNCSNTTSTFCFNQTTAPPPFRTTTSVGYGEHS